MISAPVFAFDDPNWSQVHPKAMALEGTQNTLMFTYLFFGFCSFNIENLFFFLQLARRMDHTNGSAVHER